MQGSPEDEDAPVADAGEEPTIDPAVLELDHVFEVLDHPRRRYLLYALAADDEWTLTELATKLAAWENDVDEADIDGATRDQVYVSLYHAHVPKLVEEGAVRFDADEERITPGEHTEQITTALEGAGASLEQRREAHAREEYDGEEN
jgi:hypothetical protein